MTDLPGLLERVKKCEGPDRELDAAILEGLFEWADRTKDYNLRTYPGEEPIYMHAPGPYRKNPAPCLTASTDAALGLVERVLPEWQIEQITWVPVKGGLCIASIGNFGCADDYYSATTEQPTTPPLAILAALIAALIANPNLARVKV